MFDSKDKVIEKDLLKNFNSELKSKMHLLHIMDSQGRIVYSASSNKKDSKDAKDEKLESNYERFRKSINTKAVENSGFDIQKMSHIINKQLSELNSSCIVFK